MVIAHAKFMWHVLSVTSDNDVTMIKVNYLMTVYLNKKPTNESPNVSEELVSDFVDGRLLGWEFTGGKNEGIFLYIFF